MISKSPHTLFTFVLLLSLLCGIPGCGGSTRGTGGITIEGRVLNEFGSPQPNVEVTVLQTGDSGFTDEDGLFIFRTSQVETADLLFESETFAVQTRYENLSDRTDRISATYTVDRARGEVDRSDVEIVKRPVDESSAGESNGGSANGGDGSSSAERPTETETSRPTPEATREPGRPTPTPSRPETEETSRPTPTPNRPGEESGGVSRPRVSGDFKPISAQLVEQTEHTIHYWRTT